MHPVMFVLHRNTPFSIPDTPSSALQHGLAIFSRDFSKVFGNAPSIVDSGQAQVRIVYANPAPVFEPESFNISFANEADQAVVTLTGADDLGLVYGLLYLSEHYLGVDPFWFWNEREPLARDAIEIPINNYHSPQARVRYRGWFVNDEVCLIGWTDTYPPPREIWQPVFETLLRCGGNLVIPGTDLPRAGCHWQLAAEMGLYVTHHHAEPLGAEMFFRIHPDCEASYDRNAALFEALWLEAIERQKDRKLVWVLGFRGQGDCPFWEQDPSYATPAQRGELISRVIQRQYKMLSERVPNPPCLTYLYGEITELYRQGHISLPEGVIKIWSDNGYGKMVSRRQGDHNLRVPSLPVAGDTPPHGLYYHATFHDLQASSHLVMLPVAPAIIASELEKAFASGTDEMLLLNCGNIRPHLFTLDLVSRLWQQGHADAQTCLTDFSRKYFSSAPQQAAACMQRYFTAAIQYGPHEDDKAGDEFYHHPARSLIGHLMRSETDNPADDLRWATGYVPFPEQVTWFLGRCQSATSQWSQLIARCQQTAQQLCAAEARFFRDFLLFQVQLHDSGCRGLALLCRSILEHLAGRHPQAFVLASQSLWAYQEGLEAMAEAEHGKWKHFFRADWLTNIRSTLYTVDALRKYLRMFGDNPDYFLWHKEFLMPENEKKIYLENTHRNPPGDDDLARSLRVRFSL